MVRWTRQNARECILDWIQSNSLRSTYRSDQDRVRSIEADANHSRFNRDGENIALDGSRELRLDRIHGVRDASCLILSADPPPDDEHSPEDPCPQLESLQR